MGILWTGARKAAVTEHGGRRTCFLSDCRHLPLEAAEFGELPEIPLIRRKHSDPASPRAHRDQCIIGQASLTELLVVILGRQPGEHSPRFRPVAEVRYQYSLRSIKVPFQSFHQMMATIACTGVKFFEHDRTQPHNRARI